MLQIKLWHLTLEAFGKYLSGILEKLAKLLLDTSIENFNSEYLDSICKDLAEIIQKRVPMNLADQTTERFLADILETYSDLEKRLKKIKQSRELYKTRSNLYKDIAIGLCSAVLHPSVKTFKFSRLQFPLVDHFQDKIFVNCFLNAILKKLSSVRCLKLELHYFDDGIVQENMKLMTDLEELTFFGCNDAVMKVVSDFCKELKFLDLSNSSRITYLSLDYMLQLRNLEHLKILGTAISGIEALFEGVSSFEVLKSMQTLCCDLDSQNVEFISKCFSNLTSVEFFVHEQFSLVSLKELANLCDLGIEFDNVQNYSSVLQECLEVLGPQLISLKLIDFREQEFIDIFRIVAENCKIVENLTLNIVPSYYYYEKSDLIEAATLPLMDSVNFCDLKVTYAVSLKAFLPKFVNAKVVKCTSSDDCMFESFVMELLLDLKNGKYDKVIVRNTGLQVSGENVIINKCNGSYVFVHWDNIECFLDIILYSRNFDISAKLFAR